MTIDFAASERHYADHLLPIWWGLDEDERGRWYGASDVQRYLVEAGVPGHLIEADWPRGADRLCVVAAHKDLAAVRRRPVVLLNHGAGQTYNGDARSRSHPAYTGGAQRERVVLFLCPSNADAEACRIAHPGVRAEAIGCPKLDRFHVRPQPMRSPPTIAVSFHFPLKLIPETMWAWPEYRDAVIALAAEYEVIGHGHPRAWDQLEPWYREVGIEPVRDFCEVLARADLYVADNTSTLFEFASTGRPVVVLNSRTYRREVDHGGRFWDWADVGLQVDEPADLVDAVGRALDDPLDVAQRRAQITDEVYLATDGKATERAITALRDTATNLPQRPVRAYRSPFSGTKVKTERRRATPVAEFPVRRLSRLGATAAQIQEGRERWATMPDEERLASLAEMDAQTDATLRDRLAADRRDKVAEAEVREQATMEIPGWSLVNGEWMQTDG